MVISYRIISYHIISYHHHHHKRQGLGPLARSVSRVTAVPSISSLVFQFSFFLVGCTSMLLRGLGFVAFFVGVRTISLCIRLVCRGFYVITLTEIFLILSRNDETMYIGLHVQYRLFMSCHVKHDICRRS